MLQLLFLILTIRRGANAFPAFVFYNHRMDYEKEILRVLYEAGEAGLTVQKIAVHVHNSCNTLFCAQTFADIHSEVQKWLWRNAQKQDSPVAHCDRRGAYRLDMKSSKAVQLFLEFGSPSDSTEDDNDSTEDHAKQLLLDF